MIWTKAIIMQDQIHNHITTVNLYFTTQMSFFSSVCGASEAVLAGPRYRFLSLASKINKRRETLMSHSDSAASRRQSRLLSQDGQR